MEKLGTKLKELRKAMNMTIESLAIKLNTEVSVIEEIEQGGDAPINVLIEIEYLYPGLIEENIVNPDDYYFVKCCEALEERLKRKGMIRVLDVIPVLESIKKWGAPEKTIPEHRIKAAFNRIMDTMVEQKKAFRTINKQYIIEK